MRLSILAFAAGVLFLQGQAALPAWQVIGGLGALVLFGLFCSARRVHWAFRVLSLACCALLGFVWAAGMAQQRLGDQLSSAWESRDVEITGVIASLPQRFERGERFAFDVESVQTAGVGVGATAGERVPRHVMLSWYRSWDDLDERHYPWPDVATLRHYRAAVRERVSLFIHSMPLSLPIEWDSPAWVILMGIEHERIHLETSSVLIRQLPIERVQAAPAWPVCPHQRHELAQLPANSLLIWRGA